MSITKEDLLHVAKTARLELSEEEAAKFVPQVQEIMKAFAVLDTIDVENI